MPSVETAKGKDVPEVQPASTLERPAAAVATPPREPIRTAPVTPELEAASNDVAVTPTGREIPVQYRVVDALDLVTSHTQDGTINPAYPAALQPRDRTRGASLAQISDIAAKLDPRLLGKTPKASDGAPIVSPEGIVESGNGRTLAILRAYQQNTDRANAYREFVAGQGFDTTGIAQPILVRVRSGELGAADVEAFTREANQRDTAGFSATEQAVSDAGGLVSSIIDLYRGGDIDSAGNREFVRKFIDKIVPETERANMTTADGSISQDAVRRINAAMMQKAYGNEQLVAKMTEATDNNVKAIGGALQDVSAVWGRMAEAARSGQINPAMDITANLNEAVAMVDRARREGVKVGDLVNQRDIFSGDVVDPITEALLNLMFRNAALTLPVGRQALAERLTWYVNAAMETGEKGADLLGPRPEVSPREVLDRAKGKFDGREQAAQGDLLAAQQPDAGAVSSVQQGIGDGKRAGEGAPAQPGGEGSSQGLTQAKAPKTTASPQKSATAATAKPEWGAKNVAFTKAKAEAAREIFRKNMNRLNAGYDPELAQAGMTLMGFHIEAGARSFIDASKAIAADLGVTPAQIKGYLRSWYSSVQKYFEDNGISIEGMDDDAASRAQLAKIDEWGGEQAPETAPEPEDDNIGQKLQDKIDRDYAAARAEYEAVDDELAGSTEGGRILNTDLARELSPEYRADRSRSSEVHETSSAFIKRLYADKLEEPVGEGLEQRVLFTGGGAGAGKSTGMRLVDSASTAGLVYDTTLNELGSSIAKIEQALAAGWDVNIIYTFRDPLDALDNGVLSRAERSGRTVGLDAFVKGHFKARETIDNLADRYADDPRVSITIIDNSRGPGNAQIISLDNLEKLPMSTMEAIREKSEQIVQAAYREGRIGWSTLRGTLGARAEAVRRSAEEGSDRGSAEAGGQPQQRPGELPRLDGDAGSPRPPRQGVAPQGERPADVGGRAAGQPAGEVLDSALAPKSPEADAGVRPAGPDGETGARPGVQNDGSRERVSEGGNAADGRSGAGGKRLAGSGTGGVNRPDFHISDPTKIIGGTPKVRFAKNRAAIEAYQNVLADSREPTKQELEAMAAYTGWGSFGQELFQGSWAFARPKDGWTAEDEWLRSHLGEENWKSAQASIINAHYTDPPTVQAMWDIAKKLGFRGGRVLEPSMGIGNFFSLMPKDIREKSDLTGIEMDTLSGGMAKLLFPNSAIQIMPYQNSQTPDGFYDLVIGNWPFAAEGPADRRYMKLAPSLHDFFFLKAIDQTRAGGLVMGITSAGTMDKLGRATRLELAKKAELVAAYRLPTGAFKEYAGTAVVTDILIFKKRETPLLEADKVGWIETVKMKTPAGPEITVNEYWQAHPGNVLGRLNFGSGTTYGRPAMIVDRPDDLQERLKALPKGLKKTYQEIERGNEPRFVTNNSVDRHGSITIGDDGELYQVQGERLLRLEDVAYRKITSKEAAGIRALVGLRKGYARLIDAERDGAPNVEDLRRQLNKDYHSFVTAHGIISDSKALDFFKKQRDPAYAVLRSLERADGTPSSILTKPMVRSGSKITTPSVREAFVVERNKGLNFDLESVAEAAGTSVAQATKELLDAKAIYRLPGGAYEVADVYLSGNVRQKLAAAKEAAAQGEDMKASIEALQSVIPANIPYFQIEAKLGATWVPGKQYQNFIAELLKAKDTEDVSVKYAGGQWRINITDKSLLYKSEANVIWGTEAIRFDRLLRHAFNNTSPKIYATDEDGKRVLAEGLSQQAAEKAQLIREEFATWAFREPLRRIELEESYNEVMNAIATPQYDGSFLEFPGMALEMYGGPLSLRKHQVDAIWRGLANGRGLYAHEVGTGKTLTIGGIAVEGRRFGIHQKPLVLAHNANSATVAAEINEMYPGAAVLYVDNLNPDEIKTTMHRIRNEDWDAIVMPHSLIDKMALSRETLKALAADQIAQLEEEALEAAREDQVVLTVADMDDPEALKKVRSVTAKNLVKQRNAIIANIEKQALRASGDDAIPFEGLGVDAIIVDEAHVFKKPPITTKMQLKGLNTATSNRSIALNFLTGYVKRNSGGRGTYMFTGTPITNTLTEIFNMMRYTMDDVMAKDGIDQWDAWFNTFADASSDVELNAAGEYEPVSRLASFVNVAELRRMAGQFLDIVFADDMPEFQPRETADGKTLDSPDLTEDERADLLNSRSEENPIGRPYKKIINDVAPMGPHQQGVMQLLVERSQRFRNADKKERRKMMLEGDPSSPIIVETDASNASLDVRLYEDAAPDEPDSKVNRAVRNIMRHYKEHAKAAQVVFMERGFSSTATRKGEKIQRLNLAQDLVEKLEKAGIPKHQIAIVDGSTSKMKRKEIAAKVKTAEIRVVIGSTGTLGTGVNMQNNLRAMHHLDAPWMPGELEQRNGRGWRQGNHWNTVLEYRYITEKLDGRRWQVLTVKDRFIKAFLKADESVRVIEGDAVDLSEKNDDIAQTLSDAAGDPRLLMRNKLKNDIEKLERRERAHTYGIADAIETADKQEKRIAGLNEYLPKLSDDAAYVIGLREGGEFSAKVDGKTYKKRADAAVAIEAAIKRAGADSLLVNSNQPVPIDITVNGFTAKAFKTYSRDIRLDLERSGKYNVNTPSLAGIEAIIRSIPGQEASFRDEIEQSKTSIQSLRDAAKAPFGQAESLAKRRAMYAALEEDLQANPVPAPQWLRSGAPVDTEIQVRQDNGRLEPRVVEGHRWTKTDWTLTTDKGEISYKDALDSNGVPIYDERPFEYPVVDKKSGTETTETRQSRNLLVEAPPPLAEIEDERLNIAWDRLAERLDKMNVDERVRLSVQSWIDLRGRVAGEFGTIGNGEAVIRIAMNNGAQTPEMTLDHEVVHALKWLGNFKDSEWTRLSKDALADTEMMASIRRRYPDYDEASQIEEAIADRYMKWRAGQEEKGFARAAFERISEFFRALGQLLRSEGFTTSEAVFRAIGRGDVGLRQGNEEGAEAKRYSIPADPTFDNTETERRFQEARQGVATTRTLREAIGDKLVEGWHGITRHWINLPNEPRFAGLQQKLRAIEAAPQVAKERTVRLLEDMVDGFDAKDLELFTRKVILDDLSWEASQERDLPFGFTPDTVRSELAKVDAILQADPDKKVWKAVMKRKVANRRVAQELVNAGVLEAEQIKNPAYYRHQVLEYAKAQQKFAASAGKRLKTPRWAKRMGSTMDINANLLEAEFDWLNKAFMDIPVAKSIEWIKNSPHNILRSLKDEARRQNRAAMDKVIEDAEEVLSDPQSTMEELGRAENLVRAWKGANQRIGMGFAGLKSVLQSGVLNIPRSLQRAADSVVNGPGSGEPPFALLNWILDNNLDGSIEAATIYKGIGLRRSIMQTVLGRNYIDPSNAEELTKRLAPEGYTTWQPDEGKLLFTVKTLPEHVIDGMLQKINGLAPEGVDASAFAAELSKARTMMAMGGDRYTMILPEEVAATLNQLRHPHHGPLFEFLVETPVALWKRWVIINPRRWLKYNLNNQVGDLDAVLAGNPRILKRVPEAAKELYRVMRGQAKPSDRYEEAIERGVFDSGISIQEIPDINAFASFERFATDSKKPTKLAMSVLRKAWAALQGSTQWRENVFRYAAYLDYADRLDAGEAQASIGYGASLPDMVDAVSDKRDRAALLARDLIGDYGAISHFGTGIRRTVMPFWSWMEINTKRYKRLTANAYSQGVGKGLKVGTGLALAAGTRTTARLAVQAMLIYGVIQLWNSLFFPDEEDDLDDMQQAQLHIILGRNQDGEVISLRTQGALSDALSWFGFQQTAEAYKEYERGRGSLAEVLSQPAKTTINKIATSVSPVISVPVESAMGKKLWPDVFNPRPNRDPWRNVASTLSLENEYDALADKPSRGYARSWADAVFYRRDPGEIAYNAARSITFNWLQRTKGQEGSSSYTTPRSRATYDYKKAMTYGDDEAAQKALEEMAGYGMTVKDLDASIKRASPLGPIPKKDRKAFVEGLSDQERKTMIRGIEWYQQTFGVSYE